MRTRLLLAGLLVGLVAGLLVPVAQATEWPNRRAGLVLGLNLGVGSGQLRLTGVDEAREYGFAGSARMAYGISHELLLGVEFNGWGREDEGTRRSYTTTTIAATWFPKGGSFFVRGGVGSGLASLRLPTDKDGQFLLVDEWGFAISAALGYEWRLGNTFALGAQLDTSFIDVGTVTLGDDFQEQVKVNYQNLTLALNWYLY